MSDAKDEYNLASEESEVHETTGISENLDRAKDVPNSKNSENEKSISEDPSDQNYTPKKAIPHVKTPTKTIGVVNAVSLCAVGLVYAVIVFLNAFQPNRATVSENEKRNLTAPPSLTIQSLLDGSFFHNAELYVSDTFWNRENIILLSKKMEQCFGFSIDIGDGKFAILSPDKDISPENFNMLSEEELKKRLEEKFQNQIYMDTSETESDSVTGAETLPVTDPDEVNKIIEIELSKKSLNLAVGSGTSITYTEYPENTVPREAEWIVSNENIISISVCENKVDILALAKGETSLTCKIGEATSSCNISVYTPEVKDNAEDQDDADFFGGGLFLYGDAVYVQGFYSQTNVGYMSQCADYYSKLFPNTRISVLSAPVSSMLIDNPKIKAKISDQGKILSSMGEQFSDKVNYVNIYDTLYAHKDEYLFFKSDHHWTARGAYYAYCDFARSVGFTPAPLEAFDYEVISDNFHGSMYSFTQDERVLAFSDIIETFTPRQSLTMTVTDSHGGVSEFDTVICKNYGNYISFIAGDNAYTVINVPENPQDKNILVFKDSYGNAFVPFLTQHYGNIIVIDPRYCSSNIYEMFDDYSLTDILFMNNIQCTNSYSWTKMYFNAVGIDF